MKFSDKQIETLKESGKLGHPPGVIFLVLGFEEDFDDKVEFMRRFYQDGSDVNTWYKQGVAMAEFELDSALFAEAQAGNMEAYSALVFRKEMRREQIQ